MQRWSRRFLQACSVMAQVEPGVGPGDRLYPLGWDEQRLVIEPAAGSCIEVTDGPVGLIQDKRLERPRLAVHGQHFVIQCADFPKHTSQEAQDMRAEHQGS